MIHALRACLRSCLKSPLPAWFVAAIVAASSCQAFAREITAASTAPTCRAPLHRDDYVNKEFAAAWKRVATDASALNGPLLEALRREHIVMVPGFLAEAIRAAAGRTDPIGSSADPHDYFGTQVQAFRELGLSFSVAPINTSRSVAENSAVIRREILAAPSPVLLIAHSKGGLDALDALLSLSDEELGKVAGFVPVQSPLYGTPTEDDSLSNPIIRWLANLQLIIQGGDPQAHWDMTCEERNSYMQEHAAAIKRVLARVPVLAVGTYKTKTSILFPDTLLAAPRDYMDLLGWTNDGLVPTDSTRLPGAPFIWIAEVDHISAFVPYYGGQDINRRLLTRTLLYMITQKTLAQARTAAAP